MKELSDENTALIPDRRFMAKVFGLFFSSLSSPPKVKIRNPF